MQDLEVERDALRKAHREVFRMVPAHRGHLGRLRRPRRGAGDRGRLVHAEALKEFEQIAKDLEGEGRAHEESGLTEQAYGVLKILEELSARDGVGGADRVREPGDGGDSYDGRGLGRLETLAETIDGIYGSDTKAPAGWHRKDQLRKELRREVRHEAHRAGLHHIGEVASRVEDYALRHYVKVV